MQLSFLLQTVGSSLCRIYWSHAADTGLCSATVQVRPGGWEYAIQLPRNDLSLPLFQNMVALLCHHLLCHGPDPHDHVQEILQSEPVSRMRWAIYIPDHRYHNQLFRTAHCFGPSSHGESFNDMRVPMVSPSTPPQLTKPVFIPLQIAWGACYLTLCGNFVVYLAILAYFLVFDNESSGYGY